MSVCLFVCLLGSADRQPLIDFAVVVRFVVVEDQMYVQVLGHLRVDVTQKADELNGAMAVQQGAFHL